MHSLFLVIYFTNDLKKAYRIRLIPVLKSWKPDEHPARSVAVGSVSGRACRCSGRHLAVLLVASQQRTAQGHYPKRML